MCQPDCTTFTASDVSSSFLCPDLIHIGPSSFSSWPIPTCFQKLISFPLRNLPWWSKSMLMVLLNWIVSPKKVCPKIPSVYECNLFLLLFLAGLDLHCYAQAFSSCGKWGLLLVAVGGLLIVEPSLGHRLLGEPASVLTVLGLRSCGTQA